MTHSYIKSIIQRNTQYLILTTLFLLTASTLLARPLRVWFVDVGQGDCEFIELPNGKNAIIDAGSAKNTAKLSAFLSSHTITTIDYVVLSHPDEDHYGGLSYVFDHCQVNNFYDNKQSKQSAAKVRSKAAAEPNCVTQYPIPNTALNWDPSVTVKVLSAYKPNTITATSTNNGSIVLKLTYKGESVLFTGDIDSKVENNLIEQQDNNLVSTVLKVSHHGSKYASTTAFLNKVKPKYSYIEVGPNKYGHPDPGIISRLKASGSKVYRTDTNGTQAYTVK